VGRQRPEPQDRGLPDRLERSRKGKTLIEGEQPVDAPPHDAVHAGDVDLASVPQEAEVVRVSLSLRDASAQEISAYCRDVFLKAWRAQDQVLHPDSKPKTFDFRPDAAAWIEAEQAERQVGIDVDFRKFAQTSAGRSLGVHSDRRAGIVCAWQCALDAKLDPAELLIRHASERAAVFELTLDGKSLGFLRLPATGAWGYKVEEWRWSVVELPSPLAKGPHKLRLTAVSPAPINLDCLAFGQAGKLKPKRSGAVSLSTSNNGSRAP
jgi:hypothetical protein